MYTCINRLACFCPHVWLTRITAFFSVLVQVGKVRWYNHRQVFSETQSFQQISNNVNTALRNV